MKQELFTMLNIGIIGCGTIARVRHAPEYSRNPDCRLTAFADAVPGRAAELASLYRADAFEDYRALLRRSDIDAVSLCSANQTHAVIAREALLSGKHVLCEKPMALTVEDAEMLCKTSKETGRLLIPAHNQRLFPAHQEAMKILRTGRMGRVISFTASFRHGGPESWSIDSQGGCWFFSKAAGCGVLSDLAVHKIDLINALLGEPITVVVSDLSTLDKKDASGTPIEVCDHASLLCRTEGGVHGVIMASWCNYGQEENSVSLYCENGRMLIYCWPNADLVLETRDGERTVLSFGGLSTNQAQQPSGVIDAFVDAVLHRRPPFATAYDGLCCVAAMALAQAEPGASHSR